MKKFTPLFFITILLLCSCKVKKIAWTHSSIDSQILKTQLSQEFIPEEDYVKLSDLAKVDSDAGLVRIQKRPDTAKTSAAFRQKLGYATVKIFYGTDRNRITRPDHSVSFGTETVAESNKYFVGYTLVTIPDDHTEGEIDKPHYYKLQFRKTPKNSMIEKSIVSLSDQDFDAMIKNSSANTDAFIFVHGFNNSFEDAALRTAQLSRDINYPMTPFMYSWASNGKTAAYEKDGISISAATPFFVDFIKRIAKNSQYKRLHIIAHSMGNRLVATALLQLSSSPDLKNINIDELVMAAPDIDTLTFKTQYVVPLSLCCRRVTIYGAKNDWALKASNIIGSFMRVGQYSKPPFYVDGAKNMDFINADSVKTDFLGHDRFAQSTTILEDMTKLLSTDKDPVARKVPSEPIQRHVYYYFRPERTGWIHDLFYFLDSW